MQIKRTVRTLLAAAALAGAALMAVPATQANAAVFISVGFAPPAIPVYAQPVMPGDGYIWTPGYWAYGPDGYYWVDGSWVLAPYPGALWTPGWWGFAGGAYVWYPGYWGRTVGYYGGVNYGYGYFGTGFYGGYWRGGHFVYNTAYVHVGPGFHGAVYNRGYAGFSGRPGGASFAAHPPAQFARAAVRSGVNGAVRGPEGFHGNAAPAARGAEGFHGNQGFQGNRGAQPGYDRGGASAPHYSAPAGGQYRGGSAPAAHSAAPAGGGYHGAAPAAHSSAPRGGHEEGHR